MDLDNRQAELRARTSFEAIDLGFAMTRRWAWPAWRGWLVGVVPMLAALWLSSFILPVWLVAHEDVRRSARVRAVFDALATGLKDFYAPGPAEAAQEGRARGSGIDVA